LREREILMKGGEMKKSINIILPISLLLLILHVSCVKSRVMPQPNIYFKPTKLSDVKIYYIEPDGAYIKIDVAEANGATLSSMKNVEYYLRKEASKIGGDAVIILKHDRPVRGITYSGIVYRKKYLRGIVIRWKNKNN